MDKACDLGIGDELLRKSVEVMGDLMTSHEQGTLTDDQYFIALDVINNVTRGLIDMEVNDALDVEIKKIGEASSAFFYFNKVERKICYLRQIKGQEKLVALSGKLSDTKVRSFVRTEDEAESLNWLSDKTQKFIKQLTKKGYMKL